MKKCKMYGRIERSNGRVEYFQVTHSDIQFLRDYLRTFLKSKVLRHVVVINEQTTESYEGNWDGDKIQWVKRQ